MRALLLTGCRRHEILTLVWDCLDTKAHCIRFEDTKSGAQLRPLGGAAARHIAEQRKREGVSWVFPADRGPGHFVGIARILAGLSDRAKLPSITPHTLRHTFASAAEHLGFSELIVAGLLGHAGRGVTQRYIHIPDPILLAAADRVAARIAAALDGSSGAEVVAIRRAQ